jgi:hypothetical protein
VEIITSKCNHLQERFLQTRINEKEKLNLNKDTVIIRINETLEIKSETSVKLDKTSNENCVINTLLEYENKCEMKAVDKK